MTTEIEQVRFNGSDYEPKRDNERLLNQYKVIFDLMKDGVFRTLQDIEKATKFPAASISAQMRHSRKERFGSHTVNKKHLGNGLYSYQLIVNTQNKN
jgi:hypothetical protein